MQRAKFLTLTVGLVLILGLAVSAAAGTAYQHGAVFVSLGDGTVSEYDTRGNFVQSFSDMSSNPFGTGLAFDNAGKLYLTNFSAGSVSQFDHFGRVRNNLFVTLLSNPQSISFGGNGTFWVGDAGTDTINHYDAHGNLMQTFSSSTPVGWIDALNNGKIAFTSDNSVLTLNPATGNITLFASPIPGTAANALVQITSGAFTGDFLVAAAQSVVLLNHNGNIIESYSVRSSPLSDYVGVALDSSGTAFWVSDPSVNEVDEVDLASGSIKTAFFPGLSNLQIGGLAVYTGPTILPIPEPGTLMLFGSAVFGLAARSRKRAVGPQQPGISLQR